MSGVSTRIDTDNKVTAGILAGSAAAATVQGRSSEFIDSVNKKRRLDSDDDEGVPETLRPLPPSPDVVAAVMLSKPPPTSECGVLVPTMHLFEGGATIEKFQIDVWPSSVQVFSGYRKQTMFSFTFTDPSYQQISDFYHLGAVIGESTYGKVYELNPSNVSLPSFVLKKFKPMPSRKEEEKEVRLVTEYLDRLKSAMVPSMAILVEPDSDVKGILMQKGVPMHTEDAMSFAINPNRGLNKRVEYIHYILDGAFQLQKKLIEEGFVYTDLKLQNMLLIPTDGGTRLVFTDWGGLCKWHKEDSDTWTDDCCATTFPLPENQYHPFVNLTGAASMHIQASMRYLVAALAGQLLYPKNGGEELMFREFVQLKNGNVIPRPAKGKFISKADREIFVVDGKEIGFKVKKNPETYEATARRIADFLRNPMGQFKDAPGKSLTNKLFGYSQRYAAWLSPNFVERMQE